MNDHTVILDVPGVESDQPDPVMYEAFHRNRRTRVRENRTAAPEETKPAWYERFVERLLRRLEKNQPFELMNTRDAERQAVLLGDLILKLYRCELRHRRLSFVCKKNGRIEVTLGTPMGKGGVA